MDATQKVERLFWTPELLEEFAPSVAANPWGFGRAEEVLNHAEAFEFTNGSQRALIAVKPVTRIDGTRLDVLGLVSTGDRLSAFALDAAMHQIAAEYGARQLAMSTLRPHVAAVARRTGWIQTGILMIKNMEKTQ